MEKTGTLCHRIRVCAETSKLCELRERIYYICADEEIPAPVTRLMVLAIDEAVSNIIEHARLRPEKKEIELGLEITDKRIVARISDWGERFDPSNAGSEPDSRSYPRRGFGLYLIHKIVDGIWYERTTEGQNLLTLMKDIA